MTRTITTCDHRYHPIGDPENGILLPNLTEFSQCFGIEGPDTTTWLQMLAIPTSATDSHETVPHGNQLMLQVLFSLVVLMRKKDPASGIAGGKNAESRRQSFQGYVTVKACPVIGRFDGRVMAHSIPR